MHFEYEYFNNQAMGPRSRLGLGPEPNIGNRKDRYRNRYQALGPEMTGTGTGPKPGPGFEMLKLKMNSLYILEMIKSKNIICFPQYFYIFFSQKNIIVKKIKTSNIYNKYDINNNNTKYDIYGKYNLLHLFGDLFAKHEVHIH